MADPISLLLDNPVPVAIALGGLVVVLLIWWAAILAAKLWARRTMVTRAIPAGMTLAAQPLMSADEAAFYNMLRLAVQDDYLLFAQIPLWCLFEIQTDSPETKQSFLSQIALKRVDFVLVHPGTLVAVKVVELIDEHDRSAARDSRNRLVEETVRAAGVDYVRLPLGKTYTMAELAAALDIEVPE